MGYLFLAGIMILSIPYWDFLVLNPEALRYLIISYLKAFNSLLGFSSFESPLVVLLVRLRKLQPFNSLLGFSSFESYIV